MKITTFVVLIGLTFFTNGCQDKTPHLHPTLPEPIVDSGSLLIIQNPKTGQQETYRVHSQSEIDEIMGSLND